MRFDSILAMTFGVGLLLVGHTNGQQVSKPNTDTPQAESARKEPTPQQQLERVKTEFQAALDKLQQGFRQAETPDQRQIIQLKYQELQTAAVKRSLALAAANRDTELAGQTFSWMFRAIVADQSRQIAQDQWLESHVDDASLAPTLAILGMANDQGFLRKVIKRATNKTILGAACFNLAMSLRRSEALTKEEHAEAITLLERVKSDFANIMFVVPDGPPGGRLGDLVAPPLYEFKFLSVGNTAPEINGEDIDGVKLKLSDHRGKVVLLSFWGDW